jgi:hypothetical protein
MKRIFWIASILTISSVAAYSQDYDANGNNDDVYYQDDNNNAPAPVNNDVNQDQPTYQQFYDQLSPYGQWINYPGYGYCWVPNQVPGDFSPYMTGGHWVYTEFGMTWVSDYPWGWAAFHYGRWFLDASYGWMWVPGYDWGPAWCMWGDYEGYYCWAPFGPGVIISPHYRPDPRWWHFCDRGHIMDDHFERFAVKNDEFENRMHFRVEDVNNHINYISHANTYNQSVFFSGPKAEEIQHYSGHPVNKMTITNTSHPGATHVTNNQINIYRPNIQRTTHQPAPTNVKNVDNNHPVNNRPQNMQPDNNHPDNNRPQNSNQPFREIQQQPRNNNIEQQRPTQQPMPPRQNTPRTFQQQQPVERQQPERNFIPTERPAQPQFTPQRTAPSPSFHSGGSIGGGFHGGGGRH